MTLQEKGSKGGTKMTVKEERCSAAQLRRAAGSSSPSSLDNLKVALQGWNAEQIDDMARLDGKNAVHLAAWQGSLENLKYLIETLGCDMDCIAAGDYSYGKTPIFFAATQSRNDVVDYMLDVGAFVKIINNKGQSLLSIASSHLSKEVISKIQTKEEQQSSKAWVNYRATHSDGLEYGDLDPRFLERSVRESDVVTKFSLNPTTKQSRRGSFLRRNPHLKKPTNQFTEQHTKKTKKIKRPQISKDDEEALATSWSLFLNWLFNDGSAPKETDDRDICSCVQTIIAFSEKKRQPWIPEAAKRLKAKGISSADIKKVLSFCPELSDRETLLLTKLASQVNGDTTQNRHEKRAQKSEKFHQTPQSLILQRGWKEAVKAVRKCSIQSCFVHGLPILSLPEPPVWIDTLDGLAALEDSIRHSPVVGVDSEWYYDADGNSLVSTLQIAHPEGPTAWIVDVLKPDPGYQERAQQIVSWLFSGEKGILGFAIRHDIPKIEDWLQGDSCLSRSRCLDVQLLFGCDQGLASCVSRYSTIRLSKEKQCSDWAQRPLAPAQLDYAGLDAAILLALLSERASELSIESDS